MATAEMMAVLEMVETIHLKTSKLHHKMGKILRNKIVLNNLLQTRNSQVRTVKLHHKIVHKNLNNLKNLDKMGKSLNLVKAIDHQRELLDL